MRCAERVEDIDLGTGEKRRNDLEGWIFCCRANECDVTGFHVGEKSVLLRFVEAMDFVDEDDGAQASAGFVFRGGHNFLDFLYSG